MEPKSCTPLLDRPTAQPNRRRCSTALAPRLNPELCEIGIGDAPLREFPLPNQARKVGGDRDPGTVGDGAITAADVLGLNRRVALEQALTDRIIQGRGMANLLRCGATHLGRIIFLLDVRGGIAGAYGPDGTAASGGAPPAPPDRDDHRADVRLTADGTGAPWLFAHLRDEATDSDDGWLAIGGPPAFDESDRLLLRRIAEVHALVGDRRSAAWRGGLVAGLLRPPASPDERMELARTLRLAPDGAFVVFQTALPAEGVEAWTMLRSVTQALPAGAIRAEIFTTATGQPDGILLHTPTPDLASLRAAIAAVRAELATRPGGVLAAVGTPVVGIARLDAALRQARFGLVLLQAGLVRGPLVDWDTADDLGPYRPLFPLWGAATTTDFVQAALGRLLRREARQVGDLLQTLLAFVRHAGNVGGASAELGIHRNTLTYRLRQIDDATGLSPHNPTHLLSLLLAALLWTLPEPPAEAAPLATAAD